MASTIILGMTEHQILFRQKLHRLSGKLGKTSHLLQSSLEGWLYAAFVDHHFLVAEAIKKAAKKDCSTNEPQAEPHPLTPLDQQLSPQTYLDQITAISDPCEQFEALVRLAQTPAAALLADSFGSGTAAPLTKNCLVIMGAGPVGLTLASALKQIFRDTVEILVVENRVSRDHRKHPYTRQWITNIPLQTVAGLVDDPVMSVFKNVGDKNYIGVPINLYETLLLLSAKAMGIQFLFQKDPPDLSRWAPDLIFDASGGRWMAANPDLAPAPPPKGIPGKLFNLPLGFSKRFMGFGVNEDDLKQRVNLKIADDGVGYRPLINDQPVWVPMMKLTGIPIGLFDALLAWVQQHNSDNKFYLWPGRLKAACNQVILLVNLTVSEADFFGDVVAGQTALLQDHWPKVCEAAVVDERLKTFGRLVSKQLAAQGQLNGVQMERPFVYAPYFRHRPAPELKIGQTTVPVVRMGDSIYNGHPKVGNGLGPHLGQVRSIADKLAPLASLLSV